MSTKPPNMEMTPDIPPRIAVPDELDTRLERLTLVDGAPSGDTVEKVYDNLDFTRALDACLNAYQSVSLYAMHKGLLEAEVEGVAPLNPPITASAGEGSEL